MLLRGVFILVIVLAASVVPIASIHAQAPQPGSPGTPGDNKPVVVVTRVFSGPNGVVIYIRTTEREPGRPGAPAAASQSGSQSSSSAPRCSVAPVSIGHASAAGWFGAGIVSRPGQAPFALDCGGQFQGIVWLPTQTNPTNVQVQAESDDPVDPLSAARSLLDRLPLPEIRIRFNPTTGLVALPSWFWVEGYDGSPIRRFARLGSAVVEVEVVAVDYRWRFGDGATLSTTSLGKPYPQESDIRHTYERSSLGAGGAFRVSLTITFEVRFRVNGGSWQSLDSIVRTYSAPYPVQQVQSVLTGR